MKMANSRKKKATGDELLTAPSLSVTPLVDVSFALVIFSLLTMNLFLTAGINVMESKADAAKGKRSLKENICVELTRDRKIYINRKKVSWLDYQHRLQALLPKTKDRMVIIMADDDCICEDVVELLDMSKQVGAKRLALVKKKIELKK